MFLDPGCYNTLIKKWVSIYVDRIEITKHMCQSSVHACIKVMLENLKMDILLLNRFMSLHVGLYSKRSMHASLKLVFQPSSFIDQSPSLVHRSPWHLALSRKSGSTKSGMWAGDTSRNPSTTKHATLRNGLILKALVMCSSNSANLTITRRD